MGKRELLLILVFAIVGIAIYQVSAPPSKGGGLSIGDMAQRALRQMRSENFNAQRRHEAVHQVLPTVEEVRVRGVRQVTVVGEDRQDIATELVVDSTGVDQAEADRLAGVTALKVDATPETLAFFVEYPSEGRQQSRLTVRVPRRLRARIEEARGETKVSDVAGVTLTSSRGEVTIAGIAESVDGDHRGGRLEIKGAGGVHLTVRSASLRLDQIAGPVTLDVTGGEVRMGTISGPLELDSRSAGIDAERVTGRVRVNATSGSVTLGGLQAPVRCDAQSADLRLSFEKPSAVTVFSTGGELSVTLPAKGGVTVDAATTDGELRLVDLALAEQSEGKTRRASGKVGAGGAAISLRVTGGSLILRRGGGS
jgi:hypothetical protein